jgi:hypothetical protein
MDDFRPPTIRQYYADKIRLTVSNLEHDTERLLNRGSIERWRDERLRGFVTQLETYIVGMPSERVVVHRQWPTDWWQAFRERWFPQWWLKRHPVKYERIDVDKQLYAAVCPHVEVQDHKEHLKWLAAQWDSRHSA